MRYYLGSHRGMSSDPYSTPSSLPNYPQRLTPLSPPSQMTLGSLRPMLIQSSLRNISNTISTSSKNGLTHGKSKSIRQSVHITFTTKHSLCPPVTINNVRIPMQTAAKYVGLHLDQHLTWSTHIKTKRQQLNLKLRDKYWLVGRKSKISLRNKLLLYKFVLKPVWTYGIQLWGCAKPSHKKSFNACSQKFRGTSPTRRGMFPTSHYTPTYVYPSLLQRSTGYLFSTTNGW